MTTQTTDSEAVLRRLEMLEKEYRWGEAPTANAPGRAQARGTLMTLASTGLAAGAFALAAAAFGWSYFHDPLGKGLKQYDFSTPKVSLLSLGQMYSNQDLRAMMEYNQLLERSHMREWLKSVKVRKEMEWRSEKLVFVENEENGVTKYDVLQFQKDADSGYWVFRDKLPYTFSKENESYPEREVRRWRDKGELP